MAKSGNTFFIQTIPKQFYKTKRAFLVGFREERIIDNNPLYFNEENTMNENKRHSDENNQSFLDEHSTMLNGKTISTLNGEPSDHNESSFSSLNGESSDHSESSFSLNGEPSDHSEAISEDHNEKSSSEHGGNSSSYNRNSSPEKKNSKAKSIGLGFLLVLPYLIFCIGVALISVFLFKEHIESSNIWRFIVNTNAVSSPNNGDGEEILSNGEIIGGDFDHVSITPIEKPDIEDESQDVSNEESTDVTEDQIYYNKKDFPGYKWGELWAKLSIPAIGVENKNIYVGESNSIYKKGIGKRFGTRFPGQGGNIVLGAHVTREFYDLQLLKAGDRVYIETEYGSYIYEVYETIIFSIGDYKHIMNYDKEEKLTLYTCHPRGTAYRTERFGVFCKKISGPEWIEIK